MDLSTNYQNIIRPDVNVQDNVKRQYLNLNIHILQPLKHTMGM